MKSNFWQVGELAKATGTTVRTLHHYEEVGLLSPSHRSESGYRVYGKSDIIRLQQILSLKQLGFSLEEIRVCLIEKKLTPVDVVRMHQPHGEQCPTDELGAQSNFFRLRIELPPLLRLPTHLVQSDTSFLTLE